MLLRRVPLLLAAAAGLAATSAAADSVGPLTVPSVLPSTSVSIAPTALPTLLPTLAPSLSPTLAPTLSPSIAPSPLATPAGGATSVTPQPGPVTPRPAAAGAGTQASTSQAASAGAPAGGRPAAGGLAAELPDFVVRLADTPLGPAPPIAGLALLALSAALALRRRLRTLERDRAVETAKIGFLKVASHELRTPLTVIRGYVAMAADGSLGELPPRIVSVLPTLVDEVAQLERLVEQMLLAARIDDDVLVLNPHRLDLREAVEEVMRALPEAPAHDVVLETGNDRVPVRIDRDRLRDIVGNLVDNAVKFSPEGGEVRVRVDRGWRGARLSVTDQGLGIGARDVPLLFTRFGRIVTAENSHIFGSGLGLYLVRELVRRHGGQVRVASVLGRGSTFTVELPLDLPPWARLLPARRRAPQVSEAAG